MKPTEPLPLHHSWPIFAAPGRFDPGRDHDAPPAPFYPTLDPAALARHGIGVWECDLADNRPVWSAAVNDLFGVPRGARLTREEAAALYADESRTAMERLRAYAIKHRHGFTLDAQLRIAGTTPRWMRLTAAPVCERGRVIRLHGLKQDISDRYR